MEELLVKIENAGSKATNGNGNGGGDKEEQPKSFFNKMGGAVKSGLKGAGIQFGVASLLKQSQLFTSFAGSLFQIVGGMIDLMLAPLMPIFIPVLKFLAKMMPGVRVTATAIANKLIEIGTSIKDWWTENAPSWLQGGDGTQIAQVLGGVLTALMFTKFTGVWKLGKWFLGMKVGQKAAVNAAAKTVAKNAPKTMGQIIKGWLGKQIKTFGQWLWSKILKIPGVLKLVKFVSKLNILVRSGLSSAKKAVKTFLKNAVKNIGAHIFKGSSTVTKWLGKKLMAPFKWVGGHIWKFLKPGFTRMKGIFNTIGKFINRGPIAKIFGFLKNIGSKQVLKVAP